MGPAHTPATLRASGLQRRSRAECGFSCWKLTSKSPSDSFALTDRAYLRLIDRVFLVSFKTTVSRGDVIYLYVSFCNSKYFVNETLNERALLPPTQTTNRRPNEGFKGRPLELSVPRDSKATTTIDWTIKGRQPVTSLTVCAGCADRGRKGAHLRILARPFAQAPLVQKVLVQLVVSKTDESNVVASEDDKVCARQPPHLGE